MKTCALLAALALGLVGCKKSEAPAPGSSTAAPAATPTGPRKIAIEAGSNGYEPARIAAKAGERIVLVFTRTIDGECMAQVKIAGGTAIDLPRDVPVEVPVTVPASGELKFACGMDMNTGVIVANG